jgi:hypothetical protein
MCLCPRPAPVQAGVHPCADAVVSLPAMLVALCLNTGGLAKVK